VLDKEKNVEETPVELIRQAENELINQQWAVALDMLNRAIIGLGNVSAGPEAEHLAEAHNGRGVALLELGRYAEAIKALETALSLNPELPGAHYNLGIAWEALGNADNALHNYSHAIELEPGDAEIYFRRGGVYFGLGQYEKTIADATKAIDMHAEGAAITGPYIARGLALYRLERYDQAIADYSQAATIDPRGACEAFFYRALVYIDKGEALPARADLQAFLTMTDDLDGLLAQQAREIIEELDKLD
jgi:tetratricopeptide (TPR) repeat protein